jgi:elongation factor P
MAEVVSTNELKKGIIIELGGQPYTVLDFQHLKMGRGTAQVRLKLKDVRGGHIVERTCQAGERFPSARLGHRSVQYLYHDGDLYYFMDVNNFEQFPLEVALLGDILNYFKDGMTLDLLTYKDNPIGVELPDTVDLKVAETGPAFKGDTAAGGSKPAVLEGGIAVQVPFFITTGDVVRVDTRTGNYVTRVSS